MADEVTFHDRIRGVKVTHEVPKYFLRDDAPPPDAFLPGRKCLGFGVDVHLMAGIKKQAAEEHLPVNLWLYRAFTNVTANGDLTDLLLADLECKDRQRIHKLTRYQGYLPDKHYTAVGEACSFLAKGGRYPRPKHGVLLRAAALLYLDRQGVKF